MPGKVPLSRACGKLSLLETPPLPLPLCRSAVTMRPFRLGAALLLSLFSVAASFDVQRRSVLAAPALLGGAPAARAVDVPRVGRFAPLSGAKAFTGEPWALEASAEGAKFGGSLEFRSNGDAVLSGSGGVVLGESASAWKYVNADGKISVSFTLDLATVFDDVLIFDGAIEDDDGARIRGSVLTGDAEIGARGAGKRKKVGTFAARR